MMTNSENSPMTNQDFEAMCDSPRNSKRNAKSAKRAARKERENATSKNVNHNFHDTAEMFGYYKKQNLPSSMR